MKISISKRNKVFSIINFYKAHRSEKNLVVFINLDYNGAYCDLDTKEKLYFNHGICILEHKIAIKNGFIVSGVHTHLIGGITKHTKYAVIPKNTKYFCGENNNIVSEKVIIFEKAFVFDEYCRHNDTIFLR